jgi:hypothetical protein
MSEQRSKTPKTVLLQLVFGIGEIIAIAAKSVKLFKIH